MQCQQHVRQLAERYADLQQKQIQVIVVAPGGVEEAAAVAEALDVPFPLAADPDNEVHSQFNLSRIWLGLLQRSGTVLIDREGTIRYQHAATNPNNALDLDELESSISELVQD